MNYPVINITKNDTLKEFNTTGMPDRMMANYSNNGNQFIVEVEFEEKYNNQIAVLIYNSNTALYEEFNQQVEKVRVVNNNVSQINIDEIVDREEYNNDWDIVGLVKIKNKIATFTVNRFYFDNYYLLTAYCININEEDRINKPLRLFVF